MLITSHHITQQRMQKGIVTYVCTLHRSSENNRSVSGRLSFLSRWKPSRTSQSFNNDIICWANIWSMGGTHVVSGCTLFILSNLLNILNILKVNIFLYRLMMCRRLPIHRSTLNRSSIPNRWYSYKASSPYSSSSIDVVLLSVKHLQKEEWERL